MEWSLTRLAERLWREHGVHDDNGPTWVITGCVAAGLVLENRFRVDGYVGKPNVALKPRDTKDVDVYSLNSRVFGERVFGWQKFITDSHGRVVQPIETIQDAGFYIDVWSRFFRGFELPLVSDIAMVEVESGVSIPVIRPEFQIAFKLLNTRPPRVTDVADALVVATAVQLDYDYLAHIVGESSLGRHVLNADALSQLQIAAPQQFDFTGILASISDEWDEVIKALGLTDLSPIYLLFLPAMEFEVCFGASEIVLSLDSSVEQYSGVAPSVRRLALLMLAAYAQHESESCILELLEAAYIAGKSYEPMEYYFLTFAQVVMQFLMKRDLRVSVEQMREDLRLGQFSTMHLVANQTANLRA